MSLWKLAIDFDLKIDIFDQIKWLIPMQFAKISNAIYNNKAWRFKRNTLNHSFIRHTLNTSHNCTRCNARFHRHPPSCSCCSSCRHIRCYSTQTSLSLLQTEYIQFDYFDEVVLLRADSALRTLHIFAAGTVVGGFPPAHVAFLCLLFIHRDRLKFLVMNRAHHICYL